MNPRALLAGVALAAAFGAAVATTSLVIVGDETPPVAGDVAIEPTKVVPLRDGGTAYAQRVRAVDGGEAVRIVQADCVRRLADAGVVGCRRALVDGGVVDQGALNRFPVDAGVGTRCQRVACSVYAGDSADDEETALVERTRDAGAREAREGATR